MNRMKISTKGRYGLRSALELALHYQDGAVALKTIAEKQDIPERYLQHIMVILRKEGIVESIRGNQGGYRLTRDPAEISVGEIIRTLEGPIAPVECVEEDKDNKCNRLERCVTRNFWERLKESMEEVLYSVTLEDLCEDARKMGLAEEAYMYYI
ncbi:MAG: hypothetical protein PWQ96_1536 [Clostridia bacterium]|nr:transcriptional regulator, rrf2 family [Clostridiales bacterium]MDK2985893.1 hypothetical protein [Clostridia bacterium]